MLFPIATLLLTLAAPQEPDSFWVVGRPAPHVHLPEIRSREATELASFRGKKVLLAEFASW